MNIHIYIYVNIRDIINYSRGLLEYATSVAVTAVPHLWQQRHYPSQAVKKNLYPKT